MYSRGSIVAGVLSTIACVGWILQGAGIGFFYRQVGTTASDFLFPLTSLSDMGTSYCCWTLCSTSNVYSSHAPYQLLTIFLQARTELAQHGAKAYFTRG